MELHRTNEYIREIRDSSRVMITRYTKDLESTIVDLADSIRIPDRCITLANQCNYIHDVIRSHTRTLELLDAISVKIHADIAAEKKVKDDTKLFLVIQQGGSSVEYYTTICEGRKHAVNFKRRCKAVGYKTSEIIPLLPPTAGVPEYGEFLETVVSAVVDLT